MKKVMKRSISLLLAVLLVLTGVVSDPASVHGAVKKPKKLELNMKSAGVSQGCQVKLKVKSVKPARASKQVVWSSSNKKVAQVSKSGVVKGKKAGTATITAKSKVNRKVVAKCKVKVYKATKKIKLTSEKSYTLLAGRQVKLSAKVTSPKKGAQPIQWSSGNSKVAKVDAKGKVTAVSPGVTNITGKSGKKSVKVKITVKKNQGDTSEADSETPDPMPTPAPAPAPAPEPGSTPTQGQTPEPMPGSAPEGSTRAEWVSALVDKMGYEVREDNFVKDEETGAVLYSFDDVDNSSYAGKIETAAVYGIVPLHTEENAGQMFFPGGAVTREFAAVTAVRALGMACGENLSCGDSGELSYPKEAAEAVSLGMLELKDNKFCPGDSITQAEWNKIFSVVDSILEGRKIDAGHVDVLDYTEAVVEEAEGITEYTAEQGDGNLYVTLPNAGNLPDLQPGDILPLPETEEIPSGIAIKVSGVVETEDGLVVTGTMPDVMEVYDHVDLEGSSQAVEVIPADGVTVEAQEESISSGEQRLSMRYAGRKGSGTQSVPLGYSKVSKCKITLENEDAGVSQEQEFACEFQIPELKYRFDWDTQGVNEIYVEVPNITTVSYNGSVNFSGQKELLKIPFKLPAGFAVNVVFYGVFSLDGTVQIGYTFDNAFGVQYRNGALAKVSRMNQHGSLDLAASGKIGIRAMAEFTWMELFVDEPLYTAGVEIGGAAKAAKSAGNENSLKCTNFYLYLYFDIVVGNDSLLGTMWPELSHTFSIWDENNSGLKTVFHLENGEKVPQCTFIVYSGKDHGLDWTIDVDGKLVISGTFEGDESTYDSYHKPQWIYLYSSGIKSAVITAKGMKTMAYMFYDCFNLTSLDLSGFDMSNVTNMECMFRGCSGLTNLDLSGWDTSKVTNMMSMFWMCYGLKNLDLSGWDTSKVTSMRTMFHDCRNLSSLDLSGFDTSNVTSMWSMFGDCYNLSNLDLSGFDTSNVTDMVWMFSQCYRLTSLDLSSFDTSNVINMSGMFDGCSSLISLNLSGFDTSKVIDMSAMFRGCSSLKNLDLSGFDMSKVECYSYMLAILDLDKISLPKFCRWSISSYNGYYWKDTDGNTYKDNCIIETTGTSITLIRVKEN